MFQDPNWAASIWLFRKHVLSVVVTVFGGIVKALFIPRWIILFFSFPESVCRLHYSTCTLLTLALISKFLQPADCKSHAVCYHLNGSFLLTFSNHQIVSHDAVCYCLIAQFLQPADWKSHAVCQHLNWSLVHIFPTHRLWVWCIVLTSKWSFLLNFLPSSRFPHFFCWLVFEPISTNWFQEWWYSTHMTNKSSRATTACRMSGFNHELLTF